MLTHEGRDCVLTRRSLSNEIRRRPDRRSCYRADVLLKGIRLRLALGAVAIAFGPLALLAWNHGLGKNGFSTPVGGEKWFATRPGFFQARGFKDPELSPVGTVFNWTEKEATLRFPRLERSRPASVTLRIQGANSSPDRLSEVILSVDGVEGLRLPNPTVPKRVSVDLPPRGGRGALVSIKVEGGVGVMVENVRLLPPDGSTLPIPIEALGALAFAALAAYVAAGIAGAPPLAALALSLAQASLVSRVSITGGAFLGSYSGRLLWISGEFLALSAATLVIRDLRWRRAWIAVLWTAGLKLALLSHPQVVDADAAFHAGNLGRVLAGDWFFTSATPPPAISFPYPPGLSVAALPLSGLPRDTWVSLLRVVVVIAEILATFAFARAVAALSTEAVGALTFALLAIAPEGVTLLFVGNLANLFSDALMILGCALLIGRRPIAASVSLLGGFLSHFGTLLLGAPLSLLLALGCGDRAMPVLRRIAPAALALLASFLLYYRRFMDVVVEAWDRITTLEGAAAVGPMTAPVAEKLARMGGGDSWWITGTLLVAAAIGIATWPKDRRPLANVLLLWIVVIAGFALLGLVTPVQVRSALSARPAIAALGASGLVALWSRGAWAKGLAGLIVATTAISCWLVALSFFPVKPV